MMGMMRGGQQIQRLLEETGRLPDVLYMAVVDQDGIVVAHSDPEKIGAPFRRNEISDTGPGIAAEHLGKIFDPYFTTNDRPGETANRSRASPPWRWTCF